MSGLLNSRGAVSGILGTTEGTTAAAAGGAWVQLDSSSVSGYNFDVDPGSTRYGRLAFHLIGGIPPNDTSVRFRIGASTDTPTTSSDYHYHYRYHSEESDGSMSRGTADTYVPIAGDTGVESGEGIEVNGLINHANGQYVSGQIFSHYQQHNNAYPLIHIGWIITNSPALVRNIRIYSPNSAPTAGVLTVWGLTVS